MSDSSLSTPLALLATGVVLVATAACSGSQPAGCASAKAAVHSLSPTFDAIAAGTKGAADLDQPLASAVLGLHAAAAKATGSRASDVLKTANDLGQFRSHLAAASSWRDPTIQADVHTVSTDIDVLDADCK